MRAVLAFAALTLGARLEAQCPDGTPPPCASARAVRPTVPANSVAVLYFDNLSRDTANTYLADGLTEELITSLRRDGGLSVPSRNESARIRQGGSQPPAGIARQLGVRYLLSGSVQPAAGRLRVNAELLEAATGRVVWGDRLVASGSDPMAAQESIAVAVVAAVNGVLRPEDRRALSHRGTRDSAAYDLYLRGRVAFTRGSASDAIPLFERALARDPTFANAAAGAAMAWGWMDDEVTPMVAQTEARLYAERALRLDSSQAQAWTALAGAAFQGDRDYDRAAEYAQRAATLDQSLPDPHGILAGVALVRGRVREMEAELAREWQLDSMSSTAIFDRNHFLEMLRDSIGLGRLSAYVQRKDLRAPPAGLAIAVALVRGHCDEALAIPGAARSPGPYAEALACAGHVREARLLLDSLTPQLQFTTPISLAHITMALGDRDATLAWLERGVLARQYFAVFLNRQWRWEPLRGDPRFEALLARTGH
jgi:TolB-like protein